MYTFQAGSSPPQDPPSRPTSFSLIYLGVCRDERGGLNDGRGELHEGRRTPLDCQHRALGRLLAEERRLALLDSTHTGAAQRQKSECVARKCCRKVAGTLQEVAGT